jgi:hypothetical protein
MRPLRSSLLSLLLIAAVCAPVRAAPAPPDAPRSAVFYDVSEGLGTLAQTNFTADFDALVALKGLGALGVTTAVTVYPRQPAVVFGGQEKALPGLGCYSRNARTQAKSQQERASSMEAHYEYLCRGPDAATIRAQAELAAEVLLMLVDRFATAAGGIEGGGQEPSSVLVDIDGSGPAEGLEFYEEWVHVVSPIWDTDVVT